MSRACMEELVRIQHLINIVARVPMVCRAFVAKLLSIRAPHNRVKMAARVPWRYHFDSILFSIIYLWLGHQHSALHHRHWIFFLSSVFTISYFGRFVDSFGVFRFRLKRHSQFLGGCRARHTSTLKKIVSVHLTHSKWWREGVSCRSLINPHIQFWRSFSFAHEFWLIPHQSFSRRRTQSDRIWMTFH